jgi:hypothetical protein
VFLCVVYVLFMSLSNSRVVEGKYVKEFTSNQYQNLFFYLMQVGMRRKCWSVCNVGLQLR